jgi:hypothetical protein
VREIDGLSLHVLALERVIASKRAKNRPKDRAVLPALEATFAARLFEPKPFAVLLQRRVPSAIRMSRPIDHRRSDRLGG